MKQGRVLGIFYDGSGIQYKVRYFDDAEPREEYFFDDELEDG